MFFRAIFARADGLVAKSPPPTVATPAAVSPFFTKERRLIELRKTLIGFFIKHLLTEELDLANMRKCHEDVKDLSVNIEAKMDLSLHGVNGGPTP